MNHVYVKYPYLGIVKMTETQWNRINEIKKLINENEEAAIRALRYSAKIKEAKLCFDDSTIKKATLKDIVKAYGYENYEYMVLLNEKLLEDGKTYVPEDMRLVKIKSKTFDLMNRYFRQAVDGTKENHIRQKISFLYNTVDSDYQTIDLYFYDFMIENGEIKFKKDFSKEKDFLPEGTIGEFKKAIDSFRNIKFEYYATKDEFDALVARFDKYKETAEQHEFARFLIGDSVIEKAKKNPNDLYMRNKAMYEILLNVFHDEEQASKYIKVKEGRK